MEDGTAAANYFGLSLTAEDLVALPDPARDLILRCSDNRSLAALAGTCSELRHSAGDSQLWRERILGDYPGASDYVLGAEFCSRSESRPDGLSSKERYAEWARVQRRWRSPLCTGEIGRIGARFGTQPMFCVQHAGDGLFVVGGGMSNVHVVRRRARASIDVAAEFPRNALDRRMSSGLPSSMATALPNQHALETVGEWQGSDAGVLGMHIDIASQTMVTGSFDGSLRSFHLNVRELVSLETLSAKRLKAILASKGIPCTDLIEKAEFVSRIKLYNALPVATPMKVSLGGHASNVVSVMHAGSTLLSGGNDGLAKLWDLCSGKCLHSLQCHGGHGVDSVCYDPRLSWAITGGKDGRIVVSDANSGAQVLEHRVSGASDNEGSNMWIWALRNCSTWASEPSPEALARADRAARAWMGESCGVAPLPDRPHGEQGGLFTPRWLARFPGESNDDSEEAEGAGSSSSSSSASSSGGSARPANWEAACGDGRKSIEGGSLGDGRFIMFGTTSGTVGMLDTRSPTEAFSAKYRSYASREAQREFGSSGMGFGTAGQMAGAPVSGIAPMYCCHRFVTSSFDGCVRVWDTRRWLPHCELSGGGERLTRVEVFHDTIVAGGMGGVVHMWDLRPDRVR